MEGAEVTLVARPPSSKIRLASVAALIGGYAILFGLYEILLPVSSRCLVGLLPLTLIKRVRCRNARHTNIIH